MMAIISAVVDVNHGLDGMIKTKLLKYNESERMREPTV